MKLKFENLTEEQQSAVEDAWWEKRATELESYSRDHMRMVVENEIDFEHHADWFDELEPSEQHAMVDEYVEEVADDKAV